MSKGLSFKEAEMIAVERRKASTAEREHSGKEIVLQQGKGNIRLKQLPFVEDCYRIGTGKTKAVIDNFNSLLSVEDAKKLSKLHRHLHYYEFEALLRQETPKLYSAAKGRLTYAALCTLIDFRSGKRLVFRERFGT